MKAEHRSVKPWHGGVKPSFPFPSRAYIYVFNFLKTPFTRSHAVCFLLIFNAFKCEGLGFEAFTPTPRPACFGGFAVKV